MALSDARFLKTLLICPHRPTMAEAAPLVAAALPLAPVQKLSLYPGRKEAADLLKAFEAKICFLDFASAGNGGFATLEVLQAVAPELVVIGLLSGNNPDLVLRCLRAGAVDFLVVPFTADQVDVVIEKVARRIPLSAPEAPPARVIAVVPAKGGTGATTVACNLAFQCKRLGLNRVLLADLDGLTGSVSFVLKIKSSYSFLDVLHHAGKLDEDIWRQMVASLRGLDVLLAPDAVADPTAELSTAAPILDFIRYVYDVVIADCGGPEGEWNLSIARGADEVVLVTTNELPELHATQRALVYLAANGVKSDTIRLVVNRYAEENGLRRERIASTLGQDVFHMLPVDDPALERSLMDGTPIAPGTPAGKAFATLAAHLLAIDKEQPGRRKSGRGLLSFLSQN